MDVIFLQKGRGSLMTRQHRYKTDDGKNKKNLSSRRGPDVRDKEEEETLSVSRAASPFPSFSF